MCITSIKDDEAIPVCLVIGNSALFLNALVDQPLCTIEDLRLSTVHETILQEDVLHDHILFMGIGTKICRTLSTPCDALLCHATLGAIACQSVNRHIVRLIVYPGTFGEGIIADGFFFRQCKNRLNLLVYDDDMAFSMQDILDDIILRRI